MTLKKSALSLAVATALGVAATPAMAGDVGTYGRLDVSLKWDDDGTNSTFDVFGTNSRFGFKGSEDLGNGMSALYRYEFRVFADRADIASNQRLSYVGLQSDAGTISLGRQWSAMFNHTGTIFDPTYWVGTLTNSPYRVSNVVKYAGSAGAVSYDIDLVIRCDSDPTTCEGPPGTPNHTERDDIDGYSAGLTFSGGAFSVAAAIDSQVATGVTTAGSTTPDDTTIIALAGTFGINKMVGLRGGLEITDDGSTNDREMFLIGADVNWGGGNSSLFYVGAATDDDAPSPGTKLEDRTLLVASFTHKMSKRTRYYVEGRFDQRDETPTSQDTSSILFALRHDY